MIADPRAERHLVFPICGDAKWQAANAGKVGNRCCEILDERPAKDRDLAALSVN